MARLALEPLILIVTKDAPNAGLRSAANSALGVLLCGEGRGTGGPRPAALECCAGRESAKWLEGYWEKVLRKVVEEDEGEKEEDVQE